MNASRDEGLLGPSRGRRASRGEADNRQTEAEGDMGFAGRPSAVFGTVSSRPRGSGRQRGRIIGGLKKQGFLTAQGQNIVPTDRGLALFGFSNAPIRPWSIQG